MGINITLKVSPFPSRLFAIDNQKKAIIPNKKQTKFNLDSFINSGRLIFLKKKFKEAFLKSH